MALYVAPDFFVVIHVQCSDKAEIRFREYVVGTADLVLKVPDGDAIAFNTFDVGALYWHLVWGFFCEFA